MLNPCSLDPLIPSTKPKPKYHTPKSTVTVTRPAGPKILRMSETGPDVLRMVLLEMGWKEYDPDDGNWDFWWKGTLAFFYPLSFITFLTTIILNLIF